MTPAERWLADLTSSYVPSPTQFDGPRRHRSEIESRLDAFLGVSEMFEIGSLRHGTGVRYFSDADYLVSLKGIQPTSSDTMLDRVKAQLQARYPSSTIVIRRPAVVCRFSDGDVEVVPGYAADSGYNIADPTGGWMRTYPKNHNEYVNKVNAKFDGAAKKLARQLKVWKYERNVHISSCYLEMRAAKHMDAETSYDPIWDLHAALKLIYDADLAAMNDPTGLGSRFTAYSSTTNKDDAISKLGRAVGWAYEARTYNKAGQYDSAIARLKLVFDQ